MTIYASHGLHKEVHNVTLSSLGVLHRSHFYISTKLASTPLLLAKGLCPAFTLKIMNRVRVVANHSRVASLPNPNLTNPRSHFSKTNLIKKLTKTLSKLKY